MKIYVSRARSTGGIVTVVSAQDAGLDDGNGDTKWYTICEMHDEATGHRTCDLARSWASEPETWCETCRDVVYTSTCCFICAEQQTTTEE